MRSFQRPFRSTRRSALFALLTLVLAAYVHSVGARTYAETPSDRNSHELLPAPIVSSIAVDPQGTVMATGGDDHLVRLWDYTDGRQLEVMRGHEDWVSAVTFSSDSSRLFSAGRDGQVLEWDLLRRDSRPMIPRQPLPWTSMCQLGGSEELLVVGFKLPLRVLKSKESSLPNSLECPCDDIRIVVASPDGTQFAAGGRNGRIRIWSREHGKVLHDIQAHDQRLRALAYSLDGQRLISAGEDREICIWDAYQGYEVRHIHRSRGKVLCLLALDDRRLAAGTSENVIDVWDMATGEKVTSLEGHTGSVCALARHGHRLISSGFDATIRWWDVTPGAASVALRVLETSDTTTIRR